MVPLKCGGCFKVFLFYLNFQRFDFEVPLLDRDSQIVHYNLPSNKESFEFEIPSILEKPKILFATCLDRERPYGLMNLVDKNIG